MTRQCSRRWLNTRTCSSATSFITAARTSSFLPTSSTISAVSRTVSSSRSGSSSLAIPYQGAEKSVGTTRTCTSSTCPDLMRSLRLMSSMTPPKRSWVRNSFLSFRRWSAEMPNRYRAANGSTAPNMVRAAAR